MPEVECCRKPETPEIQSPSPAGSAVRLLELTRAGNGDLLARLSDREEPVVDVRVARCFPWSLPDRMISVRDKDGNELVLLETLDGLPQPTRELIDDELRDKIFAPRIERILACEHRFGITTFHAVTDRGDVKFQLRNRDDVRVLSAVRCILKDVDGNVYEVRDLTKLDRESRHHLSDFF